MTRAYEIGMAVALCKQAGLEEVAEKLRYEELIPERLKYETLIPEKMQFGRESYTHIPTKDYLDDVERSARKIREGRWTATRLKELLKRNKRWALALGALAALGAGAGGYYLAGRGGEE